MDTRLFARIASGAFVAVALTMTALQLREGPGVPHSEVAAVWEPDGDPLALQLRACAAMGERAVAWPDCRAAWAEKRRRFLGVEERATVAAAPAAAIAPPARESSTVEDR
ncbi:MAG: putative entry exclusion protein TrbK-alt [Novosphingobium sp.]|nr:putative entry exclusion protein TrbK-alt [Novosphingobium sp.]